MTGIARPILQAPHPLLRQVATPLTPAELRGAEVQALIDDMFATVRACALLGMAAPQIGVSRRLFVVDFEGDGVRHGPWVVANPRLIRTAGQITGTEASPCLPGQTGEVTRHAAVQCRGLDRHGKPWTLKAAGLLAVCVQHEIDHLDGVLCLDKAVNLQADPTTRSAAAPPPGSPPG